MNKAIKVFCTSLMLAGCSSFSKDDAEKITVASVDINKFMGKWYVLGGRFTSFEKDVYNGTETYSWNNEKEQIDISFKYNKGSLDSTLR